MKNKINFCRNCGKAWTYLYDGDVPFPDYRNLGWRVNCLCGLSSFGSQWHNTEEEAIESWNRCIFSTPFPKEEQV